MKNAIEKSRTNEIIELHDQLAGLARKTLITACRIGELLAEQKKGMKHGTFTPWIKGNLPFTDRTAQNYMKFYRKKRILISGNTEPGSVLTITEARKRLIKHVFPKRRRGIRIPFTGGKRLLFKAWIE